MSFKITLTFPDSYREHLAALRVVSGKPTAALIKKEAYRLMSAYLEHVLALGRTELITLEQWCESRGETAEDMSATTLQAWIDHRADHGFVSPRLQRILDYHEDPLRSLISLLEEKGLATW